jgi:hypothetical protein
MGMFSFGEKHIQETSYVTQTYADSFNQALSSTRTAENSGNVNVTVNQGEAAGNSGGIGNALPLAAAAVLLLGGLYLLSKG